MKTITRSSMLYKTKVEYGDYTMNHVLGCSHGCKYPCYAYLLAKRFGKVRTYEEWTEPKVVNNTIELLEREIPRLKEKISTVHLCFTTDPFMYGFDEIRVLSLAALQKLNEADIPCTVLTKGLLPIELARLSKKNEYGITLISLNENFRRRIEPGAAPYAERLEALRALHNQGCRTWVSIEPYPTPNIINQDIYEILHAVEFTDKIIFGRTNYSREVTAYSSHRTFYNEQAALVRDFCEKNGIFCHIKEGTITE